MTRGGRRGRAFSVAFVYQKKYTAHVPQKPRIRCAFFCSDRGVEPVRDWLKGLEPDIRLEIGSDIEKVQWRWPISKPLVGAMGDGLYEVRTSVDGNIYRVFFCIIGDAMVLLHGFMKKTQKAPKRELDVARARQKAVEES